MRRPVQTQSLCSLYLSSLFVAGYLSWLHVEKIHLTSEGGQKVQDQAMFGHLQQDIIRTERGFTRSNYSVRNG